MLKAFSIQNYKNLQFEGALTFNPKLNIFIGPNNSGKSNLIDGMNFWHDVLKIGFQQSLLKRNFRAILNRYNKNTEVIFQWKINIEEFFDLKYSFGVDIPERDYHDNSIIDWEELAYDRVISGKELPFIMIGYTLGSLSFLSIKEPRIGEFNVNLSAKDSILNQIDLLSNVKGLKKFYPKNL